MQGGLVGQSGLLTQRLYVIQNVGYTSTTNRLKPTNRNGLHPLLTRLGCATAQPILAVLVQ